MESSIVCCAWSHEGPDSFFFPSGYRDYQSLANCRVTPHQLECHWPGCFSLGFNMAPLSSIQTRGVPRFPPTFRGFAGSLVLLVQTRFSFTSPPM